MWFLRRSYGHSVFDSLDNASFDADSCVAAKPDTAGNLTFESSNCGDSLPPLCYFQGQIRVGVSLDTKSPLPVPFAGARQGCYKMADERVNIAEITQRMTIQGTLPQLAPLQPTASGGNFRFVNAATGGIFISPETDTQLTGTSAAFASQTGLTKAWIGLRTDHSRRFYVPPPELENSFMSSVGYYLTPARELVIFQDTAAVPAGNNLLMVHSRKFFGPVASSSTPGGRPRVICRSLSTDKLFLTSAEVTDAQNAAAACNAEDGVFLPPIRGTEWHYATNLVGAPDPDYPWPNVGGVANTGWIGYTKTASGYRIAAAPAEGTTKLIWTGVASTAAAKKRLCVKRNGTKPSFKLIDTAGSPSPSCSGAFPNPFGPITDSSIVDTHDMLLFLAKSHSNGTLNDTDPVDLNDAP